MKYQGNEGEQRVTSVKKKDKALIQKELAFLNSGRDSKIFKLQDTLSEFENLYNKLKNRTASQATRTESSELSKKVDAVIQNLDCEKTSLKPICKDFEELNVDLKSELLTGFSSEVGPRNSLIAKIGQRLSLLSFSQIRERIENNIQMTNEDEQAYYAGLTAYPVLKQNTLKPYQDAVDLLTESHAKEKAAEHLTKTALLALPKDFNAQSSSVDKNKFCKATACIWGKVDTKDIFDQAKTGFDLPEKYKSTQPPDAGFWNPFATQSVDSYVSAVASKYANMSSTIRSHSQLADILNKCKDVTTEHCTLECSDQGLSQLREDYFRAMNYKTLSKADSVRVGDGGVKKEPQQPGSTSPNSAPSRTGN